MTLPPQPHKPRFYTFYLEPVEGDQSGREIDFKFLGVIAQVDALIGSPVQLLATWKSQGPLDHPRADLLRTMGDPFAVPRA